MSNCVSLDDAVDQRQGLQQAAGLAGKSVKNGTISQLGWSPTKAQFVEAWECEWDLGDGLLRIPDLQVQYYTPQQSEFRETTEQCLTSHCPC
jgi:hypothetical protein